jgi:membrane protein YdbS with pleckstrin-like domain
MTNPSPDSLRARFNPLIRPYLVVYVAMVLAMTVVLIPLAFVWICGVGQWWARHYFDKLECELSTTALRFRKGIIFQVEKTIPLENIQDITFIEGPLLKQFHLSILKFETAGQSAGQAHEMRLIGVIDAHDLRSQILSRREALKNRLSTQQAHGPVAGDESLAVLRLILERLDEVNEHLRRKNP